MPACAKKPTQAALAAICAGVALGAFMAPSAAIGQPFPVEPPDRAVPGAKSATPWAGAHAQGDFIAIAAPGPAPGKFVDHARTSVGYPARLRGAAEVTLPALGPPGSF